jgi:hypothetical protein
MKKKFCRWYDETSAIKRACDEGKVDKKWVENYCWNEGKDCLRKKRFEEEGYVSPDYVLPDGAIDRTLKKYFEQKRR